MQNSNKNKIPKTSLGCVALRCFQIETPIMYAQQFAKNIPLWLSPEGINTGM